MLCLQVVSELSGKSVEEVIAQGKFVHIHSSKEMAIKANI